MVDRRYTTRPPRPEPATSPDDGAWFAPKRYGYGAGLPIRWQGWALLGGYIALLPVVKLLDERGHRTEGFALFIAATLALVLVSCRKTRGGFRWRWGNAD